MGKSEFVVILLIVVGITVLFLSLHEDIEAAAERKIAKINVPQPQDYEKTLKHRVTRHTPNCDKRLNCSSESNANDTEEQHVETRASGANRVARKGAAKLKDAELAAERKKERDRRYKQRLKALMQESPELAEKIKGQKRRSYERRNALMQESPELAEKIKGQWKRAKARRRALMQESPELAEKERERNREYCRRYKQGRKALMQKSPELAEKIKGRQKLSYERRKALEAQYKRNRLEASEVEVGPPAEEQWYKQIKTRFPELAENLTEIAEDPWNKRIKLEAPEEEAGPSALEEDQWHKRIQLSGPSVLTDEQWNATIHPDHSEYADAGLKVSGECPKVADLRDSSHETTMPEMKPRLMEIINNTHIIKSLKVEPL